MLVLVLLTFRTGELWVQIVRAVTVLALFLLANQTTKDLLAQVWRIKLLILLVLIPGLIFTPAYSAITNTLSLTYGILVATLVSVTTKTSDIVNLIERITKSKSFALLIALSLNSVALVTGYAEQIIEASKARGVKPKPIRQVINLFVISLRNADQYGEALAARGVGD
jgi:biotin transport system permease protein